jgi:hypothetical protein
MRTFIQWKDGSTEEFDSREAVAEAILEALAETGENRVDNAWEEDDTGRETALGVKWQVLLEET